MKEQNRRLRNRGVCPNYLATYKNLKICVKLTVSGSPAMKRRLSRNVASSKGRNFLRDILTNEK